MAVMVATTFVLAQRLSRQEPDLVALAKVSGWAIALFAVASALPALPLAVSVAVKSLLVAALAALGVWSGALDRHEAARAWHLVRERLGRRAAASTEAEATVP
jgi:hypothetical protein